MNFHSVELWKNLIAQLKCFYFPFPVWQKCGNWFETQTPSLKLSLACWRILLFIEIYHRSTLLIVHACTPFISHWCLLLCFPFEWPFLMQIIWLSPKGGEKSFKKFSSICSVVWWILMMEDVNMENPIWNSDEVIDHPNEFISDDRPLGWIFNEF